MTLTKSEMIRPFITGAIVLGIAGYFFYICLEGLNRPYVENGWVQTQGTVLSKDLKLTGDKNLKRVQEGFEQLINYEYKVGDLTFQSNSVSPFLTVNVSDFPEGKVIDVFYNPDKPNESVLIRQETEKAYLYAMMVFCVALAGVVVFNLINFVKNN